MTACQNQNASCGSCCGIHNLVFNSPGAKLELLHERRLEFQSVNFSEISTIVSYRTLREKKEESIFRFDRETYVCPFFGPLEKSEAPERQKPAFGCMIHPSITGLENSQNFSFYGGSICQSYDCPNKEKDIESMYSDFLDQNFPGMEEYSRLMADTLFFSALEKIRRTSEINLSESAAASLKYLCCCRLLTDASRHVTSFEIAKDRFENPDQEMKFLLADAIGKNTSDGRSVSAEAILFNIKNLTGNDSSSAFEEQ